MTNKIGNGSIPLRIGNLIDTTVYGGPYRKVPEFFWGVKMAEEIDHPHMVAVDTRDFSVPEVSELKRGIMRALMAMINDEDVYAGCMGGIGRTGIFLAALAKVQIEYRKSKHRPGRGEDPVLYVRKHFIPHAVETKQQEEFIANLDVSDIVEWLNVTQTAMGLGGLTPGKSPTGRVVEDRIPLQNIKLKSIEVTQPSRMDVMQAQIDELEERLAGSTMHLHRGLRDLKNSLTNDTIVGKIRRLFK